MKAHAIRTPVIQAHEYDIEELLDNTLHEVVDYSVIVIASKVVSLCEGSVVHKKDTTLQQLVKEHADEIVGAQGNELRPYQLTRIHNVLLPNAGIDESNAGEHFVLLPQNPQKTANSLRAYIAHRFHTKHCGVIITDSSCYPGSRGLLGIPLASSGFKSMRDYRKKQDLFGRGFEVTELGIAAALAATAVLLMGEGDESTPLVILQNLQHLVEFTGRNPTDDEISARVINSHEDIFQLG